MPFTAARRYDQNYPSRLSAAASSFGQLDTDEGGQARKVPRVRNAGAGSDVVGITAPHSRAHSDLCRVHSRKARLQVLGIPMAQRLAVECRLPMRHSRCLVVLYERGAGDRFNDWAAFSHPLTSDLAHTASRRTEPRHHPRGVGGVTKSSLVEAPSMVPSFLSFQVSVTICRSRQHPDQAPAIPTYRGQSAGSSLQPTESC